MGSRSSFQNEQPAAQTQAGNPIVLSLDAYKSHQNININNEVVDFGSVASAFSFAEDALNDVLEFADEAKDQAFAAAASASSLGGSAQDSAFLAIEHAASQAGGDTDGGRAEKIGLWSLFAIVVVALLPHWLGRVRV